jgi:cytochrome c553
MMIEVAQKVTEPELVQAAAYFAALPKRPWIRTVETRIAPVTKPDYFGWLDLVKNGGTERLNGRIVELPEDWDRSWIEDPHSGVVAYVPRGSIARGNRIVHRSTEPALACANCHGADLRGIGDLPPIAGRSPSYIARMLWDFKMGARGGPAAGPMQAPVAALDGSDLTDVAAYLSTLPR